MAKPRLVILRTGSAPERVQAQFGDYVDMFRRRVEDERIEVEIVDAVNGPLPSPDHADLALITGSPHSVTVVEDWVQRLAEFTNAVMARNTPTLGVCYGHQLIAYARGGRVEVNTRGYEIGTVQVRLTDEGRSDPLLGTLGDTDALAFQAVHGDTVTVMPDGAVLLATNDISPIQAYAIGDRTWCVQFHPEFERDATAMYVEERENVIRLRAGQVGLEGDEAVRRAAASIRHTPAGPKLLSRFVDLGLERIG